MGTWSVSILADDDAQDVYAHYVQLANEGKKPREILTEMKRVWKEEIFDSDDGPVFWLALAKAQWDYGALDKSVLAQVERIVKQGLGLDRWREAGPRDFAKRQESLRKFHEKVQQANPRPKKPKPPKKTPAKPATLPTGDEGIQYPFVPKSTKNLRPGQFWAIPIKGKQFGCGRVLSLQTDKNGQVHRGMFLAGVMDWIGNKPPTADDLAGVKVHDQGGAHIKTILATGGSILGMRDLALDGNEPGMFTNAGFGGNIYRGLIYQRRATSADSGKFPVLSTYGYMVPKILAENLAETKNHPRD